MSGLIDIRGWKRREHYQLFRRAAQPWFSITAEVDVTAIRTGRAQPATAPFFLASLYACLNAANEIEAFRLRLRPDGVWLHDTVDVTSTILREDDTFAFGRFGMHSSLAEFAQHGKLELQRVKRVAPLELPQDVDDALVYHSSIPWLRFTAFTNAITDLHDSVPRIVFGRCTPVGDRVLMPVSVEVHHALVDGRDVAEFFKDFALRLATSKPATG